MEGHITSSVSDHLISGLDFRAGSGSANYVQQSRFVRFQAESGNKFSSTSSRVIRFRLSDSCYLDPTSVRLCFTLQNLSQADNLTPVTPPGALFSRLRMFAGGQLCEAVSYTHLTLPTILRV